MKILDKSKFEFNTLVPSITINPKENSYGIKLIKSIILKIPNLLNPIKNIDNEHCIYLLEPHYTKILKENDLNVLSLEKNLKSKIEFYKLSINYNNWKCADIFKAILPLENNSISSFSQIGHIIHLNLRECHQDYGSIIGQVLLDKIKTCQTVLNKKDIITHEYRNFEYELLAGKPDTIVKVRENDFTFQFDLASVFWNPRLSTERARIITKVTSNNNILVDLFSGVGPFAIPALKQPKNLSCRLVFANDLNPNCNLLANAKLNKVNISKLLVTHLPADKFVLTVFKQLYWAISTNQTFLCHTDHSNSFELNANSNLIAATNNETDFYNQSQPINFKDEPMLGDLHLVMNLPEKALEMIRYFKGLFRDNKDCESQIFSKNLCRIIVHLYCFIKDTGDALLTARNEILSVFEEAEDNLVDIDQMNSSKLTDPQVKRLRKYCSLKEEDILEIVLIRKVSPSKHMIRLTFIMPRQYMGL
ncbi:unnamed protein product [Gordionus sp. m RMFG-2023]